MDNQQITDSLLQAMEIVFAHAMEKSGVDKTLSGIIAGVRDSDKYEVKLQGAVYVIPCAIQMSFAVGDKVWVTIPQGNFNNKFISGKAVN